MTDHDLSGFSLRSIINRYLQRRREVRAVRQLLELSDTLLNDIGLTRYDVLAAVRAPSRRSPASLISSAAAENRRLQPANDASSAPVAPTVALAA
ncbi:DUF1127 domain-containing protein [Agrobacterium rubi]|nr:DUF1127 domain-containing protein [Agrobacterium rubi]NTF23985.1 DUF1127 domain-containing protein [Agrobacterium rubi]